MAVALSGFFALGVKPALAVQYGRPDGDISTSTWTTTPLWEKLDETTSDGATTQITTGNNPTNQAFEVSLSNVSDPSSSTGHVVRYAINSNKNTCSGSAALIQGTTTIASKTITSWPTTYTTDSFTLTSGQADSITDYTDLRVRLTASCTAGGNTKASWIELEVPSAPVPTKVVFTNAQRTITAGACNGAANVLTIQTQDASNNPAPPTGTTVIRVTSNSTNYTIYSDSNCTTTVTNGDFTFTTSDTTKSVYIIDRIKSNPTYTLTAAKQSGPDTITSGTQTITTQPGPANKIVVRLPNQTFTDRTGPAGTPITGTPTNQTAGGSFSFDLKVLDSQNNLVDSGTNNYTGSKTISWSDSVAGNSPSGQTPSFPSTTVTFSNGEANTLSATYYNAATSRTVEADDTGTPVSGVASSTFDVTFGALHNYEVAAATPQTAGVCFTGTNTVKARDQWNNYRTTDTSTVNITHSGSGVTFYNAAACSGGTTTSYTLSGGTATVYAITNLAQTFTITATRQSGSETGTSGNIVVNPGAHTRLVITLPGQTFTAGSGNSGTVTTRTAGTAFAITSITATDDYFNVITSYSGAKTLVYSGPNNAPLGTSPTYTTSVAFTAGQSSTTLSTTLYKAEAVAITVTDGGSYGYASSSVTVQPAPVSEMLVVLPNQSYTEAGGVTGAPTNRTAGQAFTIDIKAVDAYRNLVDDGTNAYSGSKTMSYSGPSNAPDSTPPSYTSPVTFTAGAASTVSVTLYAAETGITLSATEQGQTYGSPSTAFTVTIGGADHYLVVPSSTSQEAGVAFTVTITAQDAWNNNLGANYTAPAGTYSFTTSGGNAPDTTTPSLSTLVQGDFVNGVATKSVTLYKAEGAVSFTASEPTPSSVTGTSTSLVTVSPGDVSADSNDSTITGNAAADTGQAVTITITLKDTWRNPVSGVTASHITLDATATRGITQPTVNTDINGQTTGTITWSSGGSKTVTAAIATTPLVQNDGVTPDADGLLDDTHNVSITLAGLKSSTRGGTIIRGGSRL